MKTLIKVFEALGDETRLRMLKVLLEKKSLCVCEIMQALDISQTRASRNLGILEEAGLVVSKRKGVWVHYSANKNPGYCKNIETLLKRWLNNDTLIVEDKKRLSKAVKIGNNQQGEK